MGGVANGTGQGMQIKAYNVDEFEVLNQSMTLNRAVLCIVYCVNSIV